MASYACPSTSTTHPHRRTHDHARCALGRQARRRAGRGATAQETALYNVDPEATYAEAEESLRILGRAWQEETFERHGKLLDIAPPPDGQITILPRPQQHPHPPLYMARTKESSLKLTAEYRIGALVLGFAGPEQVARLRKAEDAYAALQWRVSFQLLAHPVTDHDFTTESYLDGSAACFLTAEHMRWFWDQYVPDAELRDHPHASPMRADLSGLPPAHIITAERDPLRTEGQRYADRLRQCGVPASTQHCPGTFHGLFGFTQHVPEFAETRDRAFAVLAEGLAKSPSTEEVS